MLSKASVDELFRSQMGPGPTAPVRQFIIGTNLDNTQAPTYTQSPEEWQDVMELGHCLCGVVNHEDVKGCRRKNSGNWSGSPNLIWFVDRESVVAATFSTQLMPVGDRYVRYLLLESEEALYGIVNNNRK